MAFLSLSNVVDAAAGTLTPELQVGLLERARSRQAPNAAAGEAVLMAPDADGGRGQARPASSMSPLGQKGRPRPAVVPEPSGATALNVALYEWVPQPDWFKAAISAAWSESHPDITLNWCEYDCYNDDPPSTLDIFAFDTIFAAYFIGKGYLQAHPVMDLDDYFAWSLMGLAVNSEWLWAVPYLGCMNVLFYRDNDPKLGPGLTNDELFQILGVSPDVAPMPPPGQGLLVDFHGSVTDACLYLQTVMENAGQYPLDPALPAWTDLDPTALTDLRQYVSMAGEKQAAYKDPGSDRLDWFVAGRGRALVGLTETMGFLTGSQLANVRFTPLPVANYPASRIPLFADAWGINRQLDPGKQGLAFDFVSIASSPQIAIAAMSPQGPGQSPQYLTPVRLSVVAKLASAFPIYQQIETLISGSTAAFRIGPGSRNWLADNANGIAAEILQSDAAIEGIGNVPVRRATPAGIWRRA